VALYATNTVPLDGLVISTLLTAAATPANGDTAATGQGVFLVVQNASGSGITVTVVTPETFDGLALADRTSVSVPATTGIAVIPLTDRYRDPATGLATINYSATTSVKAIVVRTVV
jgi:hypothetical protein